MDDLIALLVGIVGLMIVAGIGLVVLACYGIAWALMAFGVLLRLLASAYATVRGRGSVTQVANGSGL